ncbi:MAG: hypothetical protein GY759_19490 [Chloroflexi bacterium]|nr:hypothetical protein [Chloroflexota bacterium]
MIDLSKGQGTAKLVLSPSIAVAGNQAEPGLTQNWPSYGGPNRHAQLGDLYELTRIGHVLPTSGGSDGDDIHSLFVWDTDLDGTPDRSELMTANLYAQLGLEDSDEWE